MPGVSELFTRRLPCHLKCATRNVKFSSRIPGSAKHLVVFTDFFPSRINERLTSPLKMDGWNTFLLSFWGFCLFSGANLLLVREGRSSWMSFMERTRSADQSCRYGRCTTTKNIRSQWTCIKANVDFVFHRSKKGTKNITEHNWKW